MTSSHPHANVPQPGPARRTVLAAGTAAVALSATGLAGADPATAAPKAGPAAPAHPAAEPPRAGTGWQRYVQAPTSHGGTLPGLVRGLVPVGHLLQSVAFGSCQHHRHGGTYGHGE